jgi:hypothetical protein
MQIANKLGNLKKKSKWSIEKKFIMQPKADNVLCHRFQEIAGVLETVMSDSSTGVPPMATDFQLQTTATAWDCLIRCWANGVFLHQLTHRDLWISLFIFNHFE